MKESFSKIQEFEGRYEISNTGKLMVHNYKKKKDTVILSEFSIDRGYYRFSTSYKGKKISIPIHVYVAKHFPEICGEWFEGCHVHHLDGNTLNNNAENLKIMSVCEHIKIHKTGNSNRKGHYHTEEAKEKMSIARKGKQSNRKYKGTPVYGVSSKDNSVVHFNSTTAAAEFFGVSRNAIFASIHQLHNCKTVKGYYWHYEKKG